MKKMSHALVVCAALLALGGCSAMDNQPNETDIAGLESATDEAKDSINADETIVNAAASSDETINAYANTDVTFPPVPLENRSKGRNSNAYLSATGHPTAADKTAFIEKYKDIAIDACQIHHVPASAILAMAMTESACGFTRIGVKANNLFAMKIFGQNPANAWQLQGQPDESAGSQFPVDVWEDYGWDRQVYNESTRADNWYRKFDTPEAAFYYLAGKFLAGTRYNKFRSQWFTEVNKSKNTESASNSFIYRIAAAGYNHLGPDYYLDKLSTYLYAYDLYQYDKECLGW